MRNKKEEFYSKIEQINISMNKQKIKQLLQQIKKEKSSEKRQLQIVQILEMIVETL